MFIACIVGNERSSFWSLVSLDSISSTEFVVEEKCLIELFKTCRGCGKKCAVRKQVKGLKLEISQYCVHCQRCWNWTNLPDDDDHRADLHVSSKQDAAQKQTKVASASSWGWCSSSFRTETQPSGRSDSSGLLVFVCGWSENWDHFFVILSILWKKSDP